jgi:hypothetical protein
MVQVLVAATRGFRSSLAAPGRDRAMGSRSPGRQPPRRPLSVAIHYADAAPARKAKGAFRHKGNSHAE